MKLVDFSHNKLKSTIYYLILASCLSSIVFTLICSSFMIERKYQNEILKFQTRLHEIKKEKSYLISQYLDQDNQEDLLIQLKDIYQLQFVENLQLSPIHQPKITIGSLTTNKYIKEIVPLYLNHKNLGKLEIWVSHANFRRKLANEFKMILLIQFIDKTLLFIFLSIAFKYFIFSHITNINKKIKNLILKLSKGRSSESLTGHTVESSLNSIFNIMKESEEESLNDHHILQIQLRKNIQRLDAILSYSQTNLLFIDREAKILENGYTLNCRHIFNKDIQSGESILEYFPMSQKEKTEFKTIIERIFEDVLPEKVLIGQLPTQITINDHNLSIKSNIIRGHGKVESILFTLNEKIKTELLKKAA